MRFEIKTGGILAILVGIGVLSGAVFALGVLAGYDIGRESQISTAQVATTYPLASEASESSPAAASSEVGGAAEESSPEAAASTPPVVATPPPAPAAAATVAVRAMPRPPAHGPKRTAAAEVPPPAEASVPPEVSPETSSAPPAVAPAPRERTAPAGIVAPSERMAATAPHYRRHPYNIQIEAAMDRNGADSMAQRLQRLGYTPHLVPTLIAGQTWYKVEVGPYATQDEAAAAQEQLRQKYNSAYGGGSDATKPAGAGGGSDDSGTVANPSD